MLRTTTTLLPLLLSCSGALAQDGLELYDPTSGAAVTLPQGWNFAVHGQSLLATSEDREALVLLVEAGEDFEDEALRIDEELGEHVLTDVVVDEAVILIGADRGALAGAVAARGRAIIKRDARPVSFFSLLVKGPDGEGALILGAWMDVQHAGVVEQIVNSVHVRETGMEAGLELRDERTGAALKLPDGWSAFTYRHGITAIEPDRKAMAILMAPEQNFRETVAGVRSLLRETVFKDIRIGEFASVTGYGQAGVAEVLKATGTAKTRSDDADVEFAVLIAQNVEENRGLLIIGAWKEPAQKEVINRMLGTLRLPRRAAGGGDDT